VRTSEQSAEVAQPWAVRSILVAVSDLARSVGFYRALGPFDEIGRHDGVAMLGVASPTSFVLILRETRGPHHVRYGPQSLGVRSIAFDVESFGELDRIESLLRSERSFTSRGQMAGGTSEYLRGRDPDNCPLVFVSYAEDDTPGSNHLRTVVELVSSMDV
jgi:hypothetical protein